MWCSGVDDSVYLLKSSFWFCYVSYLSIFPCSPWQLCKYPLHTSSHLVEQCCSKWNHITRLYMLMQVRCCSFTALEHYVREDWMHPMFQMHTWAVIFLHCVSQMRLESLHVFVSGGILWRQIKLGRKTKSDDDGQGLSSLQNTHTQDWHIISPPTWPLTHKHMSTHTNTN